MNKNILILIVTIIVIIAIILFLIFKPVSMSPSELEECNQLSFNGNDKINLLFFAEKETVQKLSSDLFSFPPFSENKEKFNIFYVDSYNPKCELYQGQAVFCYSKELIKKSASCKTDFIITAEDHPASIRSSAYMNVISLNLNSQPSVFAHEFGHVFANLADEYTPSKIPKKSKNCAGDCGEFRNLNEGCYQGCSKDSYFRSIENGIMKTLNSNTYGKFNENLITQKISNSKNKITGNVISEINCQNQEYILLQGNLQSENQILITSKTIEQGCVGSNGNSGDYEYNLLLEDNSVLTTEDFNPEFIFTDNQNQDLNAIEGGAIESNREFILKIPKIENSKELQISKGNVLISSTQLNDLGSYPCKKS